MARPLRIERAGAWYHLTGRGIERRPIFDDEADRRHWLELLAEAVHTYRVVVHCYVLMENHFHILAQTQEPNLGRAMQWFNTSYSMWFNRRHKRVGPLFQGRYKAILVDPHSWGLELSRYVHLNPVRIGRMGLGKGARASERLGIGAEPNREQVRERVEHLRRYRWSSYPAYIGLVAGPEWLEKQTVLKLGVPGRMEQQRQAYREYVEGAIRQGLRERPWEQLVGQLVLGSQRLLSSVRAQMGRSGRREQPQARRLVRRPALRSILAAVEQEKGQKWEEFRDRHADWGRDVALYLGRQESGLGLRELGAAAGGMDYAAVSAAIGRIAQRVGQDRKLREVVEKIRDIILKVET